MTTETRETATVVVGAGPFTLDELVRVARGAPVELSAEARDRLAASRAIVDAAVEGPDLVYGLNTGLGHMRNERVEVETLGAYQEAIVASHAGAIGAPLPTDVVRAAMAARVNGIARGGAGASPAVADALVAMLNAGVHPIVPEVGSVGASDLMHMAAIGQVARGAGRAEYRGRIVDGGAALQAAGLTPLRLGPKDGLALISANGVSIGHAALAVDRAQTLADAADVVFAVSLEALGGNPSIVDPVVAAAKPVPGQIEAAARIRSFLAGSVRPEDGGAMSVQDPLSFRVVPQVHGALRAFITFAADAVLLELNAMDDNPLVSLDDGRMLSNGNFHPMVLALAVDALRPALAHVGQLSDRRLDHLWKLAFSQPLTPEFMGKMADSGLLVRYAAAVRAADLRGLANPVTLDVGTLDLGVEDHSTNAPTAVARTMQALDALQDILAVEVLSSGWLITNLGLSGQGRGTSAAVGALNLALEGLPARATSEDRHAAVREALVGPILEAAEAAR
jgi:histidine ammonia-lyase